MPQAKLLKIYIDADVLFRAATASHDYTAALVVLRMSEFTLIDLVTAAHTIEEVVRNLERFLPSQTPALLQLIARSVKTLDDPAERLLQAYHDQAHWKDVINLAAAVQAQAQLLLTYNVRDYYPASNVPQIMTPGDFVAASRRGIYHLFRTNLS